MIPISVLDLVRIGETIDPGQAFHNTRVAAQHAERLGYHRYWVAEHHNMPGIASAATAVVVGDIAAATSTIRVGAGGVMLPNHAPIVVAEQFGTLARLYPGRIDLGVGRAPGTDRMAMRALRRPASNDFPQDVLELQAYFAAASPGQRLEAVPASGTQVPIWILGSSTYGAHLAAALGLPYAFASHGFPEMLGTALDIYRREFRPSAQLAAPYVMIGVNVAAAETDAEARRLATTQQMMFTDLFRGARSLAMPPIDDIDRHWSADEKAQVGKMLACSIHGSPATVRAGLAGIIDAVRPDELILISDIYDQEARLRSLEIVSDSVAGIGDRSRVREYV